MTEISREIKVMKHFNRGGEVEVKFRGNFSQWSDAPEPLWNWGDFDYRIKLKQPTNSVYLYEWLVVNTKLYVSIYRQFMSSLEASNLFNVPSVISYHKTGRRFNTKTKKIEQGEYE